MKGMVIVAMLVLSAHCYAGDGANRGTVERLLVVMNAETVMD